MASFRQRGGRWQARVVRNGYLPEVRTFNTRNDAVKWARAVETEIDRGIFVNLKEAQRTTLAEILLRYATEVSPTKRSGDREASQLRMLARAKFAKLSLANLTPQVIAKHRDERIKKCSAGTVIREIGTIRSVLNHARREWGYGIENPATKVRLPPAPRHRDRILSDIEESRLLEILTPGPLHNEQGRFYNSTRNPWVKPLVQTALETAMRRGELLALRWADIDLQRQVAKLHITKNGQPRSVPLSWKAVGVLKSMPRSIDGRVFPIEYWTVEHVFEGACRRAGILGLHFHDLRHTATTRMAKKVPNLIELSAITGHANLSMLKRYYHVSAEELALKLG